MRRKLFTVLSALSLLPCVATAALWGRSYFVADGWQWSDGVRVPTAGYQIAWRKVLISRSGYVHFIMDRAFGATRRYRARIGPEEAEFASQFYSLPPPAPPGSVFRRALGFHYQSRRGYPLIASTRTGPPVELTRAWTAPYWPAVAATALMPAAKLATAARRGRRTRSGRCVACGYDLRATPDRCPECGRATSEREES